MRINDKHELVYGDTKVMANKNSIEVDPYWPPKKYYRGTPISLYDIREMDKNKYRTSPDVGRPDDYNEMRQKEEDELLEKERKEEAEAKKKE